MTIKVSATQQQHSLRKTLSKMSQIQKSRENDSLVINREGKNQWGHGLTQIHPEMAVKSVLINVTQQSFTDPLVQQHAGHRSHEMAVLLIFHSQYRVPRKNNPTHRHCLHYILLCDLEDNSLNINKISELVSHHSHTFHIKL